MPISLNQLTLLKNSIQKFNANLVAVSKTKSVKEIMDVYDMGQRIFGENRVQELSNKHLQLPKDIQWHAIGSLQTNKVKYIAPFITMIHSVDSKRLLNEVNKQAIKADRKISILLQIKIAEEESKQGFDFSKLIELLHQADISSYPNLAIAGVMGMASFTSDKQQIRNEFRLLKKYYNELRSSYFNDDTFKEISMGMSGDYEIALEEGATLVRIGSKIFGAR